MKSPQTASVGRHAVRVVLADDHVSIRQMLAFVLKLEGGFDIVGQADGGIEALRLCRELKPALLILDLALPELAGAQVMRLLHEQMSDVRVLVYTGAADAGLLREAMAEEPEGVVRKEDSLDELRAALRAVTAGRRHLSPWAQRICPERPSRAFSRLHKAEVAILQMIAEGRQNKEMADVLGITIKAVDHHRQRMMDCLDLHDVASLTRFAVRSGLVGRDAVRVLDATREPAQSARMEWHRGEFTISDDPAWLDLRAVCTLLAETYWANDRTPDVIERSVRHSLCLGVYKGGTQIGFARVVTDRATVGYLCDVVISDAHRGAGLGRWLLACILEHPELHGCRIDLFTQDAQEFYRQSGFGPHRFTSMVRYPPDYAGGSGSQD